MIHNDKDKSQFGEFIYLNAWSAPHDRGFGRRLRENLPWHSRSRSYGETL